MPAESERGARPRSSDRGSVVGFTWPSALVLAAAAWGYFHVYQPRRAEADRLESRRAEVALRIDRIREKHRRKAEQVSALAAGDPETVLCALREQLNKAPPGEWLP